jgi:hypothetical protein
LFRGCFKGRRNSLAENTIEFLVESSIACDDLGTPFAVFARSLARPTLGWAVDETSQVAGLIGNLEKLGSTPFGICGLNLKLLPLLFR